MIPNYVTMIRTAIDLIILDKTVTGHINQIFSEPIPTLSDNNISINPTLYKLQKLASDYERTWDDELNSLNKDIWELTAPQIISFRNNIISRVTDLNPSTNIGTEIETLLTFQLQIGPRVIDLLDISGIRETKLAQIVDLFNDFINKFSFYYVVGSIPLFMAVESISDPIYTIFTYNQNTTSVLNNLSNDINNLESNYSSLNLDVTNISAVQSDLSDTVTGISDYLTSIGPIPANLNDTINNLISEVQSQNSYTSNEVSVTKIISFMIGYAASYFLTKSVTWAMVIGLLAFVYM